MIVEPASPTRVPAGAVGEPAGAVDWALRRESVPEKSPVIGHETHWSAGTKSDAVLDAAPLRLWGERSA